MKKFVGFVAATALSALLLASCGSTKVSLQENSPVVVLSILGNSQIPWTADDPNDPDEAESDGLLSSMVNKLIDGDNPEIVTAIDRLDYADDSLRHILPEITGCEILDKNTVLESEAYEDLKASYFNALSSTKRATGYKDLTTIGAKEARLAFQEFGAKSGILLNFTFQKKLLTGNKWNGELRGIVTMKAKVLNERGRELHNKTYTAQTTERIKISSHQYKKDKFVASINSAIDDVIRQFAVDLMGETVAEEASGEEESVQGDPIALPARKTVSEEAQADSSAESTEAASAEQ